MEAEEWLRAGAGFVSSQLAFWVAYWLSSWIMGSKNRESIATMLLDMHVLHVLKVIITIISKLWEKLPLKGRKEEVVHLSFQTGVSACQSLKCPSFRIYSLPLHLVKSWFTYVGWFFSGELFLGIIIILKNSSKLWLHSQIIYVLHCIFNPLYPITTPFFNVYSQVTSSACVHL